MSTIRVSTIVFFEHDEDHDDHPSRPFAALYRKDGIVRHGPTTESIIDAAQILSQWDYGDEPHDTHDLAPWRVDEERWFIRPDRCDNDWIVYTEDWSVGSATGFHDHNPEPGDYVLTAHTKLGYTVLERVEEVAA